MRRHDPRLTLARSDLASVGLEGLIRAERFEAPTSMRLVVPAAAVRAAPSVDAEQVDQLLFGERFDVLELEDGFAWGQAARDGYVGFVEAAALSARELTPTHRVSALRTFSYLEPSIKAPSRGPFSLGALVTAVETAGSLTRVEGGGWMPAAHLAPIGADFADPAETALAFLGTPYLWGGRDSLGIDCSGLVQQALYAAGRACPRDSDLQALMGEPVAREDLMRSDLVFWRGHVGMMLDPERLLHANAHHMAVAIEPLAEAMARIVAAGGGEPTGYRRLSSPSGESTGEAGEGGVLGESCAATAPSTPSGSPSP
jgi:cell wall-associated NlpC family hydrolase